MFKEKYFSKTKENRQQFRNSPRISKRCRCNGGCEYCENNRKVRQTREIERTNYDLVELEQGLTQEEVEFLFGIE